MSNTSSLSELVVVAKRGRPARGKVVREVDWLSGLSSGVEVEVREELELVVVGGDAKKAEALAAKETKKAEALAAKETKKAEALALKEAKKAEALALKAAKNTPEAKEAAKAAKKAEALALKEAKKAEALAAKEAQKEAKKAEALALKEAKKAEALALKEAKKAEAKAAKDAAKAAKAPKEKKPKAAKTKAVVDEVKADVVVEEVQHVDDAAVDLALGPLAVLVSLHNAQAKKEPKEKKEKAPKEKKEKAPKEKKEKKVVSPAKKADSPIVVVPPALEEGELEEEEVEEEEVEVKVKRFEHNGVKWLRDSNGVIYSMETQEEVGVWNEEMQTIVMNE